MPHQMSKNSIKKPISELLVLIPTPWNYRGIQLCCFISLAFFSIQWSARGLGKLCRYNGGMFFWGMGDCFIRLIKQQNGNVSLRRESARKGLHTTSGAQFAALLLVKPVVWSARASAPSSTDVPVLLLNQPIKSARYITHLYRLFRLIIEQGMLHIHSDCFVSRWFKERDILTHTIY